MRLCDVLRVPLWLFDKTSIRTTSYSMKKHLISAFLFRILRLISNPLIHNPKSNAMVYYQPVVKPIVFIYDRVKKIVCIRAKVTVNLKPRENLALVRNYFDLKINEVLIEYDHTTGTSQQDPVLFEHESSSNYIIDPVKVPPYDQHNEPAFKDAVRKLLSKEYKVTAKVKEKPGVAGSGGQVTNTISNTGDIIIV